MTMLPPRVRGIETKEFPYEYAEHADVHRAAAS
jgi:hypothetical protein